MQLTGDRSTGSNAAIETPGVFGWMQHTKADAAVAEIAQGLAVHAVADASTAVAANGPMPAKIEVPSPMAGFELHQKAVFAGVDLQVGELRRNGIPVLVA